MLDFVRDVLTKDIDFEQIKGFLETEIEIKRLIELLAKVDSKKELDISSDVIKNALQGYDENLVNTLINEHKELMFIYNEIIKSAKAKKYSLVPVHLETFQGLLSKHFQFSDKHLYQHLEVLIRSTFPKRQRSYLLLNREMKEVALSIFYYLNESTKIKLRDETFYCFMCSFTKLGAQLKKRIRVESSLLFVMYDNSESINWKSQLSQSLDTLNQSKSK